MADPVVGQLDALEKAAKNAGDDDVIKAVEKLKTEYTKSTDPKQKEAVAKAIPDITKGLLSAVTAIKEKDWIGASAAILDILSGVSAALGPEGALVGALLSMVSMILNFFEPKQPSLLDQIEKYMINLAGVKEKDTLKAIADIVAVYVGACDGLIKEPPGKTDRQHNGVRDPGTLKDLVESLNVLDGTVPLNVWYAQHWLKQSQYQDADAWPVILNLHCEVYGRLRAAITRQYLYAYDKDRTTKYIDQGNSGWEEREKEWRRLQQQLHAKFLILVQSDTHTSDFLTEILPLARKQGLYITHWDDSDMRVAHGSKAFEESYLVRRHCRKMAITPPRGGAKNSKSYYDMWVIDWWAQNLTHSRINVETNTTLDGELMASAMYGGPENNTWKFLDMAAIPAGDAGNKFSIYIALNWDEGGAIRLYEWDGDAKTFSDTKWELSDKRMTQVRIAKPTAAALDDPDADQLPGKFFDQPIIYATIPDSTDILVYSSVLGKKTYVPIPMRAYSGIAVDPHFLWMYGIDGFACTSHASVMSYMNGTRSGTPLWLGNGQSKNIANVLDLSSCEDGTLFVLADNNRCVTSAYRVEFNRPDKGIGEWVVIDGWEAVQRLAGVQCLKLPVFGALRVQALAALLKQSSPSKSLLHAALT